MDPKKKAITAAVVGTALGVGGLVVVAMPASAGDAPKLPQVSAEDLVQSVVTAKPAPFDGTITVSNDLGLPKMATGAIPGRARWASTRRRCSATAPARRRCR